MQQVGKKELLGSIIHSNLSKLILIPKPIYKLKLEVPL